MNSLVATRRWSRAIAVPGLHPGTRLSPRTAVRYLSFTRSGERMATINTVIAIHIPETRQPDSVPEIGIKIRWKSRPEKIPEMNVSFRIVTEVRAGEDLPPIKHIIRVEPESRVESVEIKKNRALVHGVLTLRLFYR